MSSISDRHMINNDAFDLHTMPFYCYASRPRMPITFQDCQCVLSSDPIVHLFRFLGPRQQDREITEFFCELGCRRLKPLSKLVRLGPTDTTHTPYFLIQRRQLASKADSLDSAPGSAFSTLSHAQPALYDPHSLSDRCGV
jgi:hypothetical protein